MTMPPPYNCVIFLLQWAITPFFKQKLLLAEKITDSESRYGALRTDLDKFSNSLEGLEAEVSF